MMLPNHKYGSLICQLILLGVVVCTLTEGLASQSALMKRDEDYYANYGAEDVEEDEEMGEDNIMKHGQAGLASLAKGVNNIDEIAKNAKTALMKIGKALAKMGPAFKAVGFLVSLLTVFLKDGEPESKELKFMKEKFGEVNAKLDVITSRLDDVETQIEYQGAKVSFGVYTRKIKSLRKDLQFVIDAPDSKRRNKNREFFMDSFLTNYEDSAMVLYGSLMGTDQEYFGYDMLTVTSQKVKCNINQLTQLCVVTGKALTDAMAIEGAYFGFRNMTWRVQTEGSKWKDRMKKFGERCQKFLNKCADDWRTYADPLFNTVYNQKRGASNADMANHLFKKLSETLPQRNWGVWVYNDIYGFDTHTVTKSNSQSFSKWHEAKKIVTVSSTDVRYSRFNAKVAKENMLKAVEEINKCNKMDKKDPALQLVKAIGRQYSRWNGGAYYAVMKGKGLEFRGTEGHFATHDVNKRSSCQGNLNYNHHMYVFF